MPFENPTWLSNFAEMLMILVIPAGLTATYGRMVGSRRQGWAVFAAMMALFIVAVALVYAAEIHPTAAMDAAGVHGPNMEGKEQRFGIASSSLFVGRSRPPPRAAPSTRRWSRSPGSAAPSR